MVVCCSNYEKFNAVARRLWVRLQQLDATPLLPLPGLGNDQEELGYDQALRPWLTALWARLLEPDALPLPEGKSVRVGHLASPRLAIELLPTLEAGQSAALELAQPAFPAVAGRYTQQQPLSGRLVRSERVTPASHWQDVRLFEFNVGGSGLTHRPGDVLSVMPRNLEPAALAFCKVIGHSPDTRLLVRPSHEKWAQAVPVGCGWLGDTDAVGAAAGRDGGALATTLLELVCSSLDIQANPRRQFFGRCAMLAADPMHATRLDHFASPAGEYECNNYSITERHTVTDTLRDFPSIVGEHTSLSQLLDIIPRLQPRQFSIASAIEASADRDTIQLLVAMVEYKTIFGQNRKGLCTSWLASLEANVATAPIWVNSGSLKLPADPASGIICVGPGTGVAPLRSFIQYRRLLEPLGGAGPAALYFGCRNQGCDFFFADEWAAYVSPRPPGGKACPPHVANQNRSVLIPS